MTPLERRIKANALLTLRMVKDAVQSSPFPVYKFISNCCGVLDIVTCYKTTNEIEVEYDVNMSDNKTETRVLKFKSPYSFA